MSETQLVAVYGSLKKGHANHHLLQMSEFLGQDSLKVITLYDLGPYPGALQQESMGIEVEIYRVTPEVMQALDLLEEYQADEPAAGMYDRKQFQTCHGLAWLYLYNRSVAGLPRIDQGSWTKQG